MTYEIAFSKSAIKSLEGIPEPDYPKVKKTIDALAANPHPYGSIKLRGQNSYRVRQGDYRIIYEIVHERLIVKIIAVGHRKDIYE